VDELKTTALMDSPGFQAFGINHIAPGDLAASMPDIKGFTDHCKFYNCTHVHEPDCGVRQAVKDGLIDAGRYAIFTELFAEEYKETTIKMNCLCLGAVQTEMLEQAFPGYKAPLTSEQMAEFIAEFSLTANQYLNGKIIPVSLNNP
jgi:hypothetical protein